MNETNNNEIEMDEIKTTEELDLNDLGVSDVDTDFDASDDEGNYGAIIFGIGALAAAAIGGIAYAKKKKKNGEQKDGFIKKMAIKYLTKRGYTVEESESTVNDEENDDDDCDELIPNKK